MASVRKRKWTHNGVEKEAWIVNYVDLNGNRKQRTFERKKEADKFRLSVEVEIRDGTHVARSETTTLKALSEIYLRHQEDRYRDGDIGFGRLKGIRNAIDKSIVQYGGALVLAGIRYDNVEVIFRRMVDHGKLQPDTAKDRIKLLCNMEEFAVKRGFMKHRPALEYLKDLRRVKRRTIRTFTADEVAAILAASLVRPKYRYESTTKLMAIYVHLAALCGLRQGEITGLALRDIDFGAKVIRIRQAYTRHCESTLGMLKKPKTDAGVRDFPMPEIVARLLREWIDGFHKPNDMGLLLHLENGSPVRYRNWYRNSWLPLLKRAGIASPEGNVPHFHALRHFAASNMLLHQVPLADVKSIIGHQHISTTVNMYVHQLGDNARHNAIFDRMASGLMGNPQQGDNIAP